MKLEITIPAEMIAVLKAVSDGKSYRTCLKGICLEFGADEIRFVACAGHILGCFRSAQFGELTNET